MKHIKKQEEPESFAKWCKKNHKCSWEEFGSSKEKSEVKDSLLKEQENLCCYCETFITISNEKSHIEHFKPQAHYPSERYNYKNLHLSCERKESCGHIKGSKNIDSLISPLDENCEQRFTYTNIGTIITTDENDKDAINTIEMLGLNCEKLKGCRNTLLRNFDNMGDQKNVMECLRFLKNKDGEFYTLFKYIAQKNNISNKLV